MSVSDAPSEIRTPVRSALECGTPSSSSQVHRRWHAHNFGVIALYQIMMRTGWIFKTESIIMPAVLDAIGGAGWLRGCLPMLNRFGQSIPPLLFSQRLKVTPCKKWVLISCSLVMSALFLMLGSMWWFTNKTVAWWMPVVYLVLYALFFSFHGVNQLAVGTLQGKLIRTVWRGRLMLTANVIGSITAILSAWYLLPLWLRPDGGDFDLIFGCAGVCFGVAGLIGLLLREAPDTFREKRHSVSNHFFVAWRTMRSEPRLGRLGIVAMLFGTSLVLFPHYQALGRERLGLTLENLMLWVVIQNLGTGLFSLLTGPLADWRGNRLALRVEFMGVFLSPVLGILLAHSGSLGHRFYWLVFVTVGLAPVTIRTLKNYALEICQPADHPRYLSTLGLCMAAPLFVSPLVGLAVDLAGFEAVFFVTAALIFVGWLMTLSMDEPRHEYEGTPRT